MASHPQALGLAKSDTTLARKRWLELAPDLNYRPMTRQEYSPKKVFTPGNARIYPLRGTINNKVYTAPDSTYNLFYIDSIRQGIRDGLIIMSKPESKESPDVSQREGGGDTPTPTSLSHSSLKGLQDSPQRESPSPLIFDTPVTEFIMSSSSDTSNDFQTEAEYGTLKASAPFYYKEVDGKTIKYQASNRAGLVDARKQFFQNMYHNVDK